MPSVHIDLDGERISEYICDMPNCPNIATFVVGIIWALRVRMAVCEECRKKLPGKLGNV